MPAHGIHFQQQNSALRIQHARIQSLITPVNTQTGSKSSIKAGVLHAPSPCWVSTPRTTQLPITNQDLHTRNAMPAFSRIMHLLMHVENPRMGRDITQSSSSLRKSNACTAIRRKISIAFISCSINHSIQQPRSVKRLRRQTNRTPSHAPTPLACAIAYNSSHHRKQNPCYYLCNTSRSTASSDVVVKGTIPTR